MYVEKDRERETTVRVILVPFPALIEKNMFLSMQTPHYSHVLHCVPIRKSESNDFTSIQCYLKKKISIFQLYDSILRCLQDVNSLQAHSTSAMSITISMLIYHRCHSMTLKYLQSYIVRNAATLTINKRENTPLSTRDEDEQKQKKNVVLHRHHTIIKWLCAICFANFRFQLVVVWRRQRRSSDLFMYFPRMRTLILMAVKSEVARLALWVALRVRRVGDCHKRRRIELSDHKSTLQWHTKVSLFPSRPAIHRLIVA